MTRWDAVVVGSGPNGLSAAITFAQAGRSVLVLEAEADVGGATRSAPLVGTGYVNDLGSAIQPMGVASPFFNSLDLARHGLQWITPPAAVGHPLDDGRGVLAWNAMDRLIADLGGPDGQAYRRTYQPLVERFDDLIDFSLHSVLRVPRHPFFVMSFGLTALLPAAAFARWRWQGEAARALFAGHACHSVLPLDRPLTASVGLLFGVLVHRVGWPFPKGGAVSIAQALQACLEELGGEVRTGHRVRTLADIPDARQVVFALTPLQVLRITGNHFDARYRAALGSFKYGAGVFKLDYALREPIPWAHADLQHTATVHLGGTLDEIRASERDVARGRHPERPFLILAQHTLFDASRAPADRHTCWVYCHVPNGSTVDMTRRIESQIERFAPGFLDVVEHRVATGPADLEAGNANLVGGDIGGGSHGGLQMVFRPRLQASPYTTPDPRLFIGSASTAPGAAVHGMPGHLAAKTALARPSYT